MDTLHNLAARFPLFKKIEQHTGGKVKQEYAVLIIIVLTTILTLSTPLGPLLTSTIGVIIPLKETLTVLKQINTKPNELKHFIIFWMIFGLLTALDAYSSFLTAFIPLFYTLKLGLLLFIGPLRFNGGQFIYDNFISKIPEKYYTCDAAEKTINEAAKVASDVVNEAKSKGLDKEIKKVVNLEDKKDK